MRRRLRRLSIALLALAAAAGIFLLVGKFYLASPGGGARVAARLGRIYGGSAEVAGVDVGLEHVTLRNVSLGEAGPDSPPWAVIDEVRTDLAPGDLLAGETTPRHITLVGATVTLRFDAHGSLLTRLPSAGGKTGLGDLQEILIRSGRVVLKQEGRPDFIVTAVNAALTHDGSRLAASGSATAEPWGEWSLAGYVVPDNGEASLVLKRPEIHFNQTMLDGLPFVPASTWKEVQAEGDAPIELTLRYDPATARKHYGVRLRPSGGGVRVTAIDLEADRVHGEIVVADGVVRLRNVSGQTAEGTIQTNGDLDFQSTPEQLKFAVDVRALRLKRLPRSWSLPPLIDGRLTGHADLVVTLGEGKARTNGEGSGIVQDARILGLPANPMRLILAAKGHGFQFAPAVPENRKDKETRRQGDKEDYAEADLGMDHADLAKLLHGLGVRLPVPVTGRITWKARLRIPLATARDPKTYRVAGSACLHGARIEALELEQVRARIDYRDGVLRLEDLAGRVPGEEEVGRLAGRVRVGLVPSQAVDGRLSADAVDLGRLLSVFLGSDERAGGIVSGQMEFHVPLARFGDVAAWTVAGSMTSPRARVFDWEVGGGRGNFHLGEGVLSGAELAARVEGVPIAGAGRVRLTAPYIYEADLELADNEPSGIQRLARKLEVPVAVTGPLRVTAKMRGKLRPLTAAVELHSPRLRVRQIPADRLSATIAYGPGGTDYRLAGTALDGRLFVEGHVPPAGAKARSLTVAARPVPRHEGMLRLEGARLARLWEALRLADLLGPLHGIVELEITFRHDRPDHLPSGTGRYVLSGLRWDDNELADSIRGDLVLDGTRLRFRDLSGNLGEGLLRGQAVYDLGRRKRGWFNLALERVELPRLLAPWPALRSQLEGPVDIQVRGRMGADWNGSGEIHLARGILLGVEMNNARLPFDFEFAAAEGNGQIAFREAAAQAARGRVTARATYRWGGDQRLETSLRFYGVQVRALLRSLGAEISQIGTGQLSGQLDLGGTNIRSAEDLTGTFRASLQQTQAAELPVVRQLLPFLAPTQSGTAVFTAGDLEIRLAQGILRIQRFRLVGPLVQMVIEGTATLTGRLDLDATANTSSPFHAAGADMLSTRLPAVGTIPLRLLAEAAALLAGRLLHLRVTGTWRSPIIRVAPIQNLTEEAVRFFFGLATRGASIITGPSGL